MSTGGFAGRRMALRVVEQERPVDDVGQVSFQDPEAALGRVAGGLLASFEEVFGALVQAGLGDGDAVQCNVELSVAAAVDSLGR